MYLYIPKTVLLQICFHYITWHLASAVYFPLPALKLNLNTALAVLDFTRANQQQQQPPPLEGHQKRLAEGDVVRRVAGETAKGTSTRGSMKNPAEGAPGLSWRRERCCPRRGFTPRMYSVTCGAEGQVGKGFTVSTVV